MMRTNIIVSMGIGTGQICTFSFLYSYPYPIENIGYSPYPYSYSINVKIFHQNENEFKQYSWDEFTKYNSIIFIEIFILSKITLIIIRLKFI